MAYVVGQIIWCTAPFLLFFYFHTGANKIVDLIADLMALGELLINVMAGISVPNEPRDFYKKLIGSYWRPATAVGSALARGSHNRKMTGPHRQG